MRFVEVQEGIIYEDAYFTIYAKELRHVVPCYGYRIEQKDLPGELLIDKAQALGVPKGPLLGQLKMATILYLKMVMWYWQKTWWHQPKRALRCQF